MIVVSTKHWKKTKVRLEKYYKKKIVANELVDMTYEKYLDITLKKLFKKTPFEVKYDEIDCCYDDHTMLLYRIPIKRKIDEYYDKDDYAYTVLRTRRKDNSIANYIRQNSDILLLHMQYMMDISKEICATLVFPQWAYEFEGQGILVSDPFFRMVY